MLQPSFFTTIYIRHLASPSFHRQPSTTMHQAHSPSTSHHVLHITHQQLTSNDPTNHHFNSAMATFPPATSNDQPITSHHHHFNSKHQPFTDQRPPTSVGPSARRLPGVVADRGAAGGGGAHRFGTPGPPLGSAQEWQWP